MDILTFLFQKMTFLKNILGTFWEHLVIFTNLQINFQKVLNPSTSWNELVAYRTLQMIENGPGLKTGHPWSRPIKIEIKIYQSVEINFLNMSRLSLLTRQDYFLSRSRFLKYRFLNQDLARSRF